MSSSVQAAPENPVRALVGPYVKAAYPVLAVETFEEDRFILGLVAAYPHMRVHTLSTVGGLQRVTAGQTERGSAVLQSEDIDAAMNFDRAWAWACAQPRDTTFLVILDWAGVMTASEKPRRHPKRSYGELSAKGNMIFIVSHAWNLPPDLTHDIPCLSFDLPNREALGEALRIVSESVIHARREKGLDTPEVTDEQRTLLLNNALGLTLREAEGVFSLAIDRRGVFDPLRVVQEKMRALKGTGYLEYFEPVDMADVGGLGGVKRFIRDEALPSWSDPVLRAKGLLLCGCQGTGKSLISKAISGMFQMPLIRFDVAACMGGHVGESESNMKAGLRRIDALAPCVVMFDEVEKALGGHQSSAKSDGGTLLRMVGQLLTWMQEHKSEVFIVATCNDHAKLPAELYRRGRLDYGMFVDLPRLQERTEIAGIHLRRLGLSPEFDGFIAARTEGFSGAEIEGVVISSARRTHRALTEEAILAVIADERPLSRVKADEIAALRAWGKATLRPASDEVDDGPTSEPAKPTTRRIEFDEFE